MCVTKIKVNKPFTKKWMNRSPKSEWTVHQKVTVCGWGVYQKSEWTVHCSPKSEWTVHQKVNEPFTWMIHNKNKKLKKSCYPLFCVDTHVYDEYIAAQQIPPEEVENGMFM